MANASPNARRPNATYILLTRVGGNVNFRFGVGVTQSLAFLDTNMLVYPMQNRGVGGLSQHEDQTQLVMRRSGI